MTALHWRRHDPAVRGSWQSERRGGGDILTGGAVVAALRGRGVGGRGAVGRPWVCEVASATRRRRAVSAAERRYAAESKHISWAVKARSLRSTNSERS